MISLHESHLIHSPSAMTTFFAGASSSFGLRVNQAMTYVLEGATPSRRAPWVTRICLAVGIDTIILCAGGGDPLQTSPADNRWRFLGCGGAERRFQGGNEVADVLH